jgi:hypothetical protein
MDTSNMGQIEAMMYRQLDKMGVTIAGKLRRLPDELESGAVKEWLIDFTFPDGRVLSTSVPWDVSAFSSTLNFAKENL